MKRRYQVLRVALSAAVLFAALAAGARGLPGTRAVQDTERTPFRLTGEEGLIAGVVGVEGDLPPRPAILMEADPACAAQHRSAPPIDNLVVTKGRLADALVYVEAPALEAYAFELPQWEAALERRRCRTVPHVLGVQARQTLRVYNSDPTSHNYNFQTKVNPLVNRSLAPKGSFEVSFQRPEPPFPVRCNQHPWERGFVAVMPHPFFAVTGRSGAFSIAGLPPGDYEVVVWHEKFKEMRAKVSVGAREAAVANFKLRLPADMR